VLQVWAVLNSQSWFNPLSINFSGHYHICTTMMFWLTCLYGHKIELQDQGRHSSQDGGVISKYQA